MSMTDFDWKALGVLIAACPTPATGWKGFGPSSGWQGSLIRANAFGEKIWGRARGSSSAPWARVAGKALNRLKREGYAEYVVRSEGNKSVDWGWTATRAGRNAYGAHKQHMSKGIG